MTIRPISLSDHSRLVPFWKENYFFNELDGSEPFRIFLEKNPSLSFLAEENGEIVGAVLGSFDGRRGYIQKLVVRKDWRRKKVGTLLARTVIKALKAAGALYIPISAEKELVPFYEKCGFARTEQVPLSVSYSTYVKK